jgi:stage V sporulation protein R
MTTHLDTLSEWDERIQALVKHFGLRCYPQEFEICDHEEMLGYMAYSGMPSRYPHWSFGKGFERQKTLYDHGVSGLPYEMVINSNPCLAYLMRDNTLLLQILTIAHVYGHNDFFANNFTFTSGTDAKHTLERFHSNARRVASYIEDPSIGIERVEDVLDNAHALSFQCTRNLAIKKRTRREQQEKRMRDAYGEDDPNWEIHPKKSHVQQVDLSHNPLEPEEDILLFIADHNPFLPEWKRDLLRIVDFEARYFLPQIETKIMNEGWASYWHHKLMNALELPHDLHLEFLVRHNQVLRPHPGGINPYHLGFILFQDIERRWNHGLITVEDLERDEPGFRTDDDPMAVGTVGRNKIFEVRESDRDASFLRRFLTEDVIRELALFQHEKRGKERQVTKVADDEGWKSIKETLIQGVGTGSFPTIKIEDADFNRSRSMYLKHYHDGRDLLLEYAEATLRHVRRLWGREVLLETLINGKKTLIRCSSEGVKVEKI